MASSNSRDRGNGRPPQPCETFSADSQPATMPATVLAAIGPRQGTTDRPCSRYRSMVARPAARPALSTPTGAAPGSAITQKPSPPMLFICG